MTLEALRKGKKELGNAVYKLLKDFENKYGVCSSITIIKDISCNYYSNKKYLEAVIVEITL